MDPIINRISRVNPRKESELNNQAHHLDIYYKLIGKRSWAPDEIKTVIREYAPKVWELQGLDKETIIGKWDKLLYDIEHMTKTGLIESAKHYYDKYFSYFKSPQEQQKEEEQGNDLQKESEYSISSPKTPRMQEYHKKLEKDLLKTPKIKKEASEIVIEAQEIEERAPLQRVDDLINIIEQLEELKEMFYDTYWTKHGGDIRINGSKDYYEFNIKMRGSIYEDWMEPYQEQIDERYWQVTGEALKYFVESMKEVYDWIQEWSQVGRMGGWLVLESDGLVRNIEDFIVETPSIRENIESDYEQRDIDESIQKGKDLILQADKRVQDLEHIKSEISRAQKELQKAMSYPEFWRNAGIDIPPIPGEQRMTEKVSPEVEQWEERWHKGGSLSKTAEVAYYYGDKKETTPEGETRYTVFKVIYPDDLIHTDEGEIKAKIKAKEMGMGLAGGLFVESAKPYDLEENYTVVDTADITDEQVKQYQQEQVQEREQQEQESRRGLLIYYDESEIMSEEIKHILSDEGDLYDKEYIYDHDDEIMEIHEQVAKSEFPQDEFIKRIKEAKLYDRLEKLVQESVYEDTDILNWRAADFYSNLTSLIQERSPDGNWHVRGVNMGWRGVSGEKEFTATTAQEFLDNILPKTQDFSIYVYDYQNGKGFRIVVYHHDAPTGETYYASSTGLEREDIMQWEERWHKASSIKIAQEQEFKPGDKVKLRPDALQMHARSVPAHMGYTPAQFRWREILGEIGDSIGVVEKVSEYRSHVDVDFPTHAVAIKKRYLIKVEGTPIDEKVEEWEERWHKESGMNKESQVEEFKTNMWIIFTQDAKFKMDQLDAEGEIKENMVGKVKQVKDDGILVEIGKQVYEIPFTDAFKILEPFQATVISPEREMAEEPLESTQEAPETPPESSEAGEVRPEIAPEREMGIVPIRPPRKPVEKALETESILKNMMVRLGIEDIRKRLIPGTKVTVKLDKDYPGQITKQIGNSYQVKLDNGRTVLVAIEHLEIGAPKVEPEIETKIKPKKEPEKPKVETSPDVKFPTGTEVWYTADPKSRLSPISVAEVIGMKGDKYIIRKHDGAKLEADESQLTMKTPVPVEKPKKEPPKLPYAPIRYSRRGLIPIYEKDVVPPKTWVFVEKRDSYYILGRTVSQENDMIAVEVADGTSDYYPKDKVYLPEIPREMKEQMLKRLTEWTEDTEANVINRMVITAERDFEHYIEIDGVNVGYNWLDDYEGEMNEWDIDHVKNKLEDGVRAGDLLTTEPGLSETQHRGWWEKIKGEINKIDYPKDYDGMLDYIGSRFGYSTQTDVNDYKMIEWGLMWLDQEVESVNWINSVAARNLQDLAETLKRQIGPETMMAVHDAFAYSGSPDMPEVIDSLEIMGIKVRERVESGRYYLFEGYDLIKSPKELSEPSEEVEKWEERWHREGQLNKKAEKVNLFAVPLEMCVREGAMVEILPCEVILSPWESESDEEREVSIGHTEGRYENDFGENVSVVTINGKMYVLDNANIIVDERDLSPCSEKKPSYNEEIEKWEERWCKESQEDKMDRTILAEVEVNDQMLDEDGMWLSREMWEPQIKRLSENIEELLGRIERGINVTGQIQTYLEDLEKILEKIPNDQILSAGEYVGKFLDEKKTSIISNILTKRAGIDMNKKPLKELNKILKKRDKQYIKDQKDVGKGKINEPDRPNINPDINSNPSTRVRSSQQSNMIKKAWRKVEILRGIYKGKTGELRETHSDWRSGTTYRVRVGNDDIWYQENEVKPVETEMGFRPPESMETSVPVEKTEETSKPAASRVASQEFPVLINDISAGFSQLINEIDKSHNPYVVSDIGKKLYKKENKNSEIVKEGNVSRINK